MGIFSDLYSILEKAGLLGRLKRALMRNHRVMVLGSTGVGKTQFLRSLQEAIPEAIDAMNRTAFIRREKFTVHEKLFEFIDIPGESRRDPRQEVLYLASREEIEGIINVVAGGYHEYRDNASEALLPNGLINPTFQSQHKRVEIDDLRIWGRLLGERPAHWMVTLVNKADLWWDRRAEILGHYEMGQYHEAVAETATPHNVVPYSSVFHKFYGIGPLSGHFDDRDRDQASEYLIRVLLEGIGQEDMR